MGKSKKLNLTNVNKEYAKFNDKFIVHVIDGQYDVEIQRYFKTTDIQKMLIDYQELLEQLRKQHIDIDTIQGMTYLFPILLIKYFTNIDVPMELDKLLLFIEKLVDIGAYEEILNNLPQDQVQIVNKMLEQISENQNKIGDLIGDIMIQNSIQVEEDTEENPNANV